MEQTGAEIVTPEKTPLEPAADKKEEPKKDEANEVEFLKGKAKAFEKEAQAAAKKLAAYEKAEEERREAEKSDLQKAQEKAAKLEAELKAKELSILRRDIAAKVELPAVLADRLKGETAEEIEADAKALLETLPKNEKKAPSINPTNPGGATQSETTLQKKQRLGLTAHTDIFSDQFNARKDGGVVIPFQE